MTSVESRTPFFSSVSRARARLSSASRMAARACGDPGPKLCWAESGLFIHKSEKVGTPFFHRCSVKARVVQSLRVGVFNESFGNGPRAFVSSVIRFSGRVAPAKRSEEHTSELQSRL